MAERVAPVGTGFVGIYLFFCIFLYFIEYMKKFFCIFINLFKVINSGLRMYNRLVNIYIYYVSFFFVHNEREIPNQ